MAEPEYGRTGPSAPPGTYVPLSGGTSTGEQIAPDFQATGKTGATATPLTIAGGTASGAPASGAHVKGELVADDTGRLWFCTVAGTPGTWVQANSTTFAPIASPTFTGEPTAPDWKTSGVTGATAASRYVGATVAGAPTTGTFAVGDFVVSQAGRIWVCTGAGTPGTWEGLINASERGWSLPTGGMAQTYERNLAAADLAGILSTGRLNLVAIYLRAGQTINSITFVSGSTPLSVGSNQWFSLYSSARAKLAVTNDDTSTAWAANTPKTLTLASAYPVTASGLYYLGITVVATTVPTLRGNTTLANVTTIAPILAGSSSGSLTNPASAPDPAAALTAQGLVPYAYVS